MSEDAGARLAREVAAALRSAGHEAWLVGGCVRDRLLGRPVHDRDLTTDATPAQLRRLFPDAVEVGAHFGVVLIRRGGAEVQVATYRSERGYRDGRHPDEVRFETDVRADLARRDFTINALLEDPFTGEVIDHVGGLGDLRAGLIRAIGDPRDRFAEDHLRMLRAVRFAAELGFAIEPRTWEAIRGLAPAIVRISAERIRDELSRILAGADPRRGFELLDEARLLEQILPEVARMKGVEQPPDYHPEGDVWTHTLLMLGMLRYAPLDLAWGCLLHDVGKPVTQTFEDRIRFSQHEKAGAEIARAILERLRYPREFIERVVWLVAQHMRFKDAMRMNEATFRRFIRQPGFDTLLELYRIDLASSGRPLEIYEQVRQRRAALPPEALHPPPLVRGRDLVAMGYQPGPAFSRALKALEEEQLAGRVRTREEAEQFVRRVLESQTT
ncbi:MAG: CCA tRNA nucleotidyltransferase [Bryobacteraceae bacterium]|nr:CCA tRNA nucleotidyltransferase [Bryobacteraceae bacterium]